MKHVRALLGAFLLLCLTALPSGAVTLCNNAWMTTATTGTGTLTLGSNLAGYQTFAECGVTNGQVVRYRIFDGSAWEMGSGTYTSAGTTLSRTVLESSNADAAISLSGTATVTITPLTQDLPSESIATDGTIDEAAYLFALEGGILSRYLLSDVEAALDLPDFAGILTLAKGGTGANLTDPNADRFMFWDDSAGAATWLTPAAPIAITGTTVDITAASDTADGSCELATTTEATTGTDTTRCVTPAGLAAAISASASHVNIQTFTASGTYTPTAGLDHAVVTCTGGGGGGGSGTSNPGAGNGGSGGGTSIEEYSAATIGASQTVTIGAGGAGSSSGAGSDGGDTTFGALMTATKGVGGAANTSATLSAGGIPTGGDVNITGGDGGSGATVTGWALGGIGGGTHWGPGGAPTFTTSTGVTGGNGNAYGSGGAGGATNATGNGTGGNGKDGICVITEYY